MPGYPHTTPSVAEIGGSVFTSLAHRLAAYRGEVFPLHVGDTWLEPASGCRMEDLSIDDHPGMHRYAPPQGLPALLDAVVERTSSRTGVPTERRDLLIGAGATGALGAVMGAILDPGDEVLVPAPFWPLIPGVVRCFRGIPVVVPFLGHVDSAEAAVQALRARRTRRTVALYLNTPNNPTGRVIPGSWLEAIADWAGREGLWLVSDEVYEDYVYEGEHRYCRSIAPGRTFSVHSFSKAFGMAGNRCGYVVGPSEVMGELRKVSTHSFYSSPTASQIAARRALEGPGDAWVAGVRERYRETGRRAAERLGVDSPEGSTFLFVDVSHRLDDRGLTGFLEDCADRGLFLAPGPSFGPFPEHVRLCFTAAPPDVVARGLEVLAALLHGPVRRGSR